ncbi:Cactin_mid domain-containing protein [Caenorhabditis elegans]|uniref:Cactin_mid domain-containing protein n=1 Tax=Caenorhabditis elegans TaxID=6239 RepID=Q93510_CAEEL|nr:Cactin_mid domain-containing protein [Caenorhabditis elegans]CAB02485.1 Cactin_mid domain-containing protein [Caenorhabditis elegans]|eukprot:NP_496803.1 Uncharacterized protein CELE_F15D4.2 [Caenorhabditis elegans]
MPNTADQVDPLLASLSHFVDHTDLLAEHTMNAVEWEAVEVLMPRILRGKSKEDVKQLLLAEIDGMSKKRLDAVLAGETLEESSSSEDEEEQVIGSAGESEKSESPEIPEPEAKMEEQAVEAAEASEASDDGREDGEIRDDQGNTTSTPPDPGSPKSPEKGEAEQLDTDEEIDRLLEEDLEDFL